MTSFKPADPGLTNAIGQQAVLVTYTNWGCDKDKY